jgi:hypothetical protein
MSVHVRCMLERASSTFPGIYGCFQDRLSWREIDNWKTNPRFGRRLVNAVVICSAIFDEFHA